jgi:hypothetical protein
VWKQDLTIIPLAAYIYFLCFFDRSNIGNAKVLNSSTKNDMQTEIHATSYEFNIALMIFLVGQSSPMPPLPLILDPANKEQVTPSSKSPPTSCSRNFVPPAGWPSSCSRGAQSRSASAA